MSWFTRAALALAFAIVLAACGSDDSSTDASTDESATESDSGSESSDGDATDDTDDVGDEEAMDDADDAMEEDDAAMSEDAVADDEDGDGGDDGPSAMASEAGNLSIVSIDFDTAEIELVNNTDAAIDINGWVMCNFPTYVPISGVDPIGPGETVVVTSTVAVPPTDGALAIYTAEDFTNPEAIVAYVEWGSDGHTRASVAAEAGIWDGAALTPDGSTLTVAG